jgi:hypothetical protein
MSPPSTELKDERSKKLAEHALLDADCLLGLLFDPEDEGDIFLRKSLLTYTGLSGVISQKIKFFYLLCFRLNSVAHLHNLQLHPTLVKSAPQNWCLACT